jgi:iron complex outermembrane receptor protein
VGLKTTLADGKWRFNINYFRNDYKDLQLTAFDASGNSILTNAASALLKGFEVETVAQITSNWQVNAHLGTLDNNYKDFSAASAVLFAG